MYSLLLDGDWASNALSWQWVAGSNANKKYLCNQDNINRYFNSTQKNTFLDISYDRFEHLPVPETLKTHLPFKLNTSLPASNKISIVNDKRTLLYNYYNLDPNWHAGSDTQRILLLEPSFFNRYPVHQHCIDFVLALSENIPGIQVFVGEFNELAGLIETDKLIYKEHPTNRHYIGTEEERDWMFDVNGYYSSFFAFWKKCKKQLPHD